MSRTACHRNLKRFASKKIKAQYNLDLFKGKLVSVIERFEEEELKFMFKFGRTRDLRESASDRGKRYNTAIFYRDVNESCWFG